MNIVHDKHVQYTDSEMIHIAKKLGKLATYCKRIKDEGSCIRIGTESRKTVKKRDQIKVAITIELPNKDLRAESRRDDLCEAVDRCFDKLKTQVIKYKEMHTSVSRARRARAA